MTHLKQKELVEKLNVKAKQLQQYQVIIWHESFVPLVSRALVFLVYGFEINA